MASSPVSSKSSEVTDVLGEGGLKRYMLAVSVNQAIQGQWVLRVKGGSWR